MNNSAGHLKPSDLRGRVFSFQPIAASLGWRWRADKHWSLGAEASYHKNDSNGYYFSAGVMN